jgi:glutamyl-tRNA synthetase
LAPRVRFAPSPTGFFHVGSARTALFNWLFARQRGGVLVLRIEDTDTERGRTEWLDGIISAMAWLGLEADEGPFHQTEVEQRHRDLAEFLFEQGYLYACDCSRTEIDERTKDKPTPGYDGYCRDRGLPRSAQTALRFKVPEEGETIVDDVVRGRVVFPHQSMEDFVVVKSSGHPLFALANVVDDRDMQITHVIRGEDLLPTTPKQLLLWEALDLVDRPVALPQFAHLPMLVNEQRKKLSKRKDPVAVESYRDKGYLADAFVNYLALLGWSPEGDREIVDRATLIEEFRLDQVHHAPAFFDVVKLTHMNGEYLRALSLEEFIDASLPWVSPERAAWQPEGFAPPWGAERFDDGLFRSIAPLIQERVSVLSEVPTMVDFLFLEEPIVDPASFDKVIAGDELGMAVLHGAIEVYAKTDFNAASLHRATLEIGEQLGIKLRKAQAPIRVGVTGRSIGPPLFESLELLGRDEVLRRLRAALGRATG